MADKNRRPRDPLALLRATRPGDSRPAGRVDLIVSLTAGAPDADARRRLEGAGFTIERVVGDKVIGSIDSNRLAALKALPQVREVETSVRLKPHAPR